MNNENESKQISVLLDQIIEFSREQDKKNPECFLFGVMIAQSFITFHLLALKDLINNEKR